MAWVLLIASAAMFAITFLLSADVGREVARRDIEAARAALIVAAIFCVASMALLFAAGMMFGGA